MNDEHEHRQVWASDLRRHDYWNEGNSVIQHNWCYRFINAKQKYHITEARLEIVKFQ